MHKSTANLVLLGSGEFTPALDAIDRHLFELTGKSNPVVAILPTAAGQEPNASKWIQDGKAHLSRLGAEPVGLEVYNRQQADQPKWAAAAKAADIFYLSGGDPGYLTEVLAGSKLWDVIERAYRAGKLLVGSSAGAMAMGNYVFANPYQSFEGAKESARWEPALNLVDYAILPHYDYMRANLSAELKTLWRQTPAGISNRWLGIDEDTALIIQGDQAKVMGKGSVSVTTAGKSQVYNRGQSFTI